MLVKLPTPVAPDVGTLVEYGLDSFGREPGRYRVSAWLRVAPPPPPVDYGDLNSVIDDILFEACQRIEVTGERMQFCLRDEATHLSLSGVCGRIAPIEACKVTGMVNWTQELLDSARDSAIRKGRAHTMIFGSSAPDPRPTAGRVPRPTP